jgi:thiamine-phosphate pyrophosphorylase
MAIVTSAQAGLRAAKRATMIQLRAPLLSTAAFENETRELVAAVSIPVLVSSRCDVALASGAAGVNLPERDVSVADARTLLGDLLVGRSVHSIEAALQAEAQDADFVIFGPVWESASHPGLKPAGLSALEEVARAVGIPVFAIGGVTEERIDLCLAAGADGYAAIGLFTSPPRGEVPAKPGEGSRE